MATPRPGVPKRRLHHRVATRIDELVDEQKWTPTQIYQALVDDPKIRKHLPSQKTVERQVKDLTPSPVRAAAGGPVAWSLDDGAEEDARYVLPVLAAAIEWSGGAGTVSYDEARIVVRVGRCAPGLPPLARLMFARRYARLRALGQPTTGLEHFLALKPWTDDGVRYARAFATGKTQSFETFAGCDVSDEAWAIVMQEDQS